MVLENRINDLVWQAVGWRVSNQELARQMKETYIISSDPDRSFPVAENRPDKLTMEKRRGIVSSKMSVSILENRCVTEHPDVALTVVAGNSDRHVHWQAILIGVMGQAVARYSEHTVVPCSDP